MLKTKIYNLEAKEIGELQLDKRIFGVKINEPVVQQVVEAHLANRRQVLAHTKQIGEVRGGGKKPWRQKGTGRARHGSIRSPLWKGGSVTFGPTKDRNFAKKVNQKMKQKALFMVLSDKFNENKLTVLEDFNLTTRKTKDLLSAISKFNLKDKKIIIGIDKKDSNMQEASKNLKTVKVMPIASFNVYSLLNFDNLFLTKKAVEAISKHFNKIKSS
ncbi:MAG TPA: 50S ribosomal protein L4 [bacterium]|jgi:large subunit ribosomal protein L4|nr:50S ribosomal protein L4 [bacterium]HOG38088.1 50S ribosomal protein L4 [bacterium]HQI03144.1 50S ribosomal protein L4 [bacterium]